MDVFVVVVLTTIGWFAFQLAKERISRPVHNPALICPHCQAKGQVIVRRVKLKAGISGAKATSALLTGGLTLIFHGLSRTPTRTQCSCGNCHMDWLV